MKDGDKGNVVKKKKTDVKYIMKVETRELRIDWKSWRVRKRNAFWRTKNERKMREIDVVVQPYGWYGHSEPCF